jgi:phospholipase/carboxylesterase
MPASPARLVARPVPPHEPSTGPGPIRLSLGGPRDGTLHVPPGVAPGETRPLLVFFHGAGGDAGQAALVLEATTERRVLVLAIDSRRRTWDLIGDALGPDVTFLDRALAWTFARHAIDPARVAVSGFSDGASYALTLGRANGDLFSAILAFSPGFEAAPEAHGAPRIFVSHGVRDRVLPIDACSRRLVPRLRAAGYDIEYHELDAAHAVPAAIARAAVAWFTTR